MLRAIHLIPEFSNSQSIDALRCKYDPLVHKISPHVTLVFPFESDLTVEVLTKHVIQSTMDIKPFRFVLAGATGTADGYLFMNVKVGNDEVIQLHDKLYTGILKPFLNRSLTYTPHVTIGRTSDKRTFACALAETEHWNDIFETTIHDIVLETIDEHGNSMVDCKLPLLR